MALVLDGNGTMTVGNGDITGLVAGALPSTVIGAGAVLQVVQTQLTKIRPCKNRRCKNNSDSGPAARLS